jgi:hypothetical protein
MASTLKQPFYFGQVPNISACNTRYTSCAITLMWHKSTLIRLQTP